MNIKQQIEQDLKSAMLAGDKQAVSVLRGLKSAVLYAEVEVGKRDSGLSDEEVINVYSKEAKKRQESAGLYRQGGEDSRAAEELAEKSIIDRYLPAQLSETELGAIIDRIVAETEVSAGMQAMGQVIGKVKQQVGAQADGAVIARLVREKLSL